MTESLPPPGAGRPRGMGRYFPPPDEPGARAMAIIGLVVGVAISAVAWGLFLGRMNGVMIAVVIGGKILGGIACLAAPRWRPLGQGLIASVAIGALIFLWKVCSGIEG